jgi:hypothetical protein
MRKVSDEHDSPEGLSRCEVRAMGLGNVREVANGTGHGTPGDDEGRFVGLGDIGEKVSGKGMAEFGIIAEKVSEVMESGVRAAKRGTTFGRGTTSTFEMGEGGKTGFVQQQN